MIQINNICKSYNDKVLFDNYNLQIQKGEKVLIAAPSGSGKTTLIRIMMGFELTDSGTVVINDLELTPKNIKDIRSKIAYVSQDSDLEDVTVEEQLDLIFSYKVNRHLEHYKESFMAACQSFGLPPKIIHEKISRISGGERQRVALAIALTLKRPIMILDEITSGLDSRLKSTIIDTILNLDQTVITISHDTVWKNYNQIREVHLT